MPSFIHSHNSRRGSELKVASLLVQVIFYASNSLDRIVMLSRATVILILNALDFASPEQFAMELKHGC